ncbi:hypothetical protein FE257_000966 [Aspergillus nanangensis]|uniref:Nephrocystin 3-like N-terminal domain-containing protein n=1 Tax=Aspergillus nanangensis TaxID=2582783 RepID=A0AAD4CEB5_ASPNN|nr:hypothetical protein FE257_000966 [Aspergillus nanangensis]
MEKSLTATLSDLSTANVILDTFVQRVPRLYVIIDGLDECNNGRKDLLDILRRLVIRTESYAPGKLRVALLSQPSSEIKNSLPETEVLALLSEHNQKDIQKYCQQRKRELDKFEFADGYLKQTLDRICTKADGMFLFAKLVMNNLSRQPTR